MVDLRTSTRPLAAPRTPGDDVSAPLTAAAPRLPNQEPPRHSPPGQLNNLASPRKLSRVLPTPDSLVSSTSKLSPLGEHPRLPPGFEPTPATQLPAVPSRYVYTPQSPYRPGEYQRSECAPSERTRIERKLFEDDDSLAPNADDQASSSPLAPAFEAKMVLRNGASVDLISWLRTNFHHQPPPHTAVTSFMSLVHVQRLLQERFPRVPEPAELRRAVLVAFPRSEWEEPADNKAPPEPPLMRGLTWHGRDVADEDEDMDTPGKSKPGTTASRHRSAPRVSTGTAIAPNGVSGSNPSRSPTQSPLMSPDSNSTRRLPDTPARSVLDEFAEIATRTPVMKECSLDNDLVQLPIASIERPPNWRKRRASQSPQRGRRASTPDALQGLLDAAEALEGSPLTMLKHERGHKRRRTIAGSTTQDFAAGRAAEARRARSVRGTASPKIAGLSLLHDKAGSEDDEPVSPLASEESTASQLAALGSWRRGAASSTASQLSHISESVTPSQKAGRKVNELPTSTQGQFPGVDCKPPYPYHEMIRHAIEAAPDRKLQLAQIYSSIANRFPFFKTLDEKKTAGWQNSIRHNLSLKKMFVRVNKADGTDEGGKGGWWTVQPGVPDEGRPGRKAKAKRAKDLEEGSSVGSLTAPGTAASTPVPGNARLAPASPAPSIGSISGTAPLSAPSIKPAPAPVSAPTSAARPSAPALATGLQRPTPNGLPMKPSALGLAAGPAPLPQKLAPAPDRRPMPKANGAASVLTTGPPPLAAARPAPPPRPQDPFVDH